MYDTINMILSYVPAFWRRRWLMIGIAWLICVLGWSLVALIPNTYSSSARVYVDTDSLLRPLLRGLAIETNTLRQIEVMQRTLLTRPNLEEIARRTDLDLGVTGAAETAQMIGELRRNISLRSSGANIYVIGAEHGNAATAKKIVEALLSMFVEGNLGNSRQEMDAAKQFIQKQIAKYEADLDAAEQRIAEFKKENSHLLPGAQGYHERLQAERHRLTQIEAELADTISRNAEFKRQLADLPEYLEIDDDSNAGPPSNLQVRILEIETSIDQLLLKYTEKHPDVIIARRRLVELKDRLKEEQGGDEAGQSEGTTGPGTNKRRVPNEVYQSIKLQQVQEQSKIVTLRNQIERQKQTIVELESLFDKVPKVETELKRLTRDYGVMRDNYQQFLARQETANITDSRDTEGEKVQFRVIEPPNLPTVPDGIKRSLYLTVVLVAGLAAGGGLGGLVVFVQQSFFGVARLAQSIGMPVLGSVSMIMRPGRRSWRGLRLASFAAVCVALVGSYGSLMLIEQRIGLPDALPKSFIETLQDVVPESVVEKL